MIIRSPAFKNQAFIPVKYTADGENIIPPLTFENVPAGAKSLALIMEDPDAPRGTFDHWIVFNLPKESRQIREGEVPIKANFGKNSLGETSYVSPSPPPGKIHRYIFNLYALDTLLPLNNGVTKAQVETAMQGHILVQCSLTGLYKR